tara:strand:+ start:12798 stop:13205 length:408 start_codon:yes stop_codon:yes gene_type:complete
VSLADIKARTRRAIHGRLAVPATLVDEDHPDGLIFADGYQGATLTVRYHNKLDRSGDLTADYAEIIDGIDRLVFHDENVAEVSAGLIANGEAALTLSRGAEVTIAEYKGLTFVLDSQQPPDGPGETVWVVARKRG